MTGAPRPDGGDDPSNDDIASRFELFADLLAADGVEYKPTAYRRAAENIRDHPRSVAALARENPDALEDIDRVGDAIASKIIEYVETGTIGELQELREELPVDMAALTSVEGVGPKTVGALYDALGVEDLDDLAAAAEAGEIREVKGFGEKTEANIREGIAFAREARERSLLGDARPVAEAVVDHLTAAATVERVAVAGSIRRWQPTVGDVDVLVAADDGAAAIERFTGWPGADDVIEAGDTKASVRGDGVRVDCRAVAPAEFGAALQYFTGDKNHNVALRNRAIERDLKLNEYGAFDVSEVEEADAGQRAGERVAGETEEGMYAALDLPLIPPELRRNAGEIAAADRGDLPDLVPVGAINGDLHTHSDWSGDGRASIEDMVAAAAERGHDYHAVTDHLQGPGTPPSIGLEPEALREQVDAVAAAREDAAIEVLHGVEANVGSDGEVDVPDDLTDELDVVVASPHAALSQDEEAATERLVTAVEHPHVDVLGHPSGRLLNERPGLAFDVEQVAAAAADHDTALEVNSNPRRLDLSGTAVRTAVEAGAPIAVNTDAHGPDALADIRYGIHTARRGWATEADIINARDLEALRAFLH